MIRVSCCCFVWLQLWSWSWRAVESCGLAGLGGCTMFVCMLFCLCVWQDCIMWNSFERTHIPVRIGMLLACTDFNFSTTEKLLLPWGCAHNFMDPYPRILVRLCSQLGYGAFYFDLPWSAPSVLSVSATDVQTDIACSYCKEAADWIILKLVARPVLNPWAISLDSSSSVHLWIGLIWWSKLWLKWIRLLCC